LWQMASAFSEARRAAGLLPQFGGFLFGWNGEWAAPLSQTEYTRLTILLLSGIMSITDKNAFARRFGNIGTHAKNQSGMEGQLCFG